MSSTDDALSEASAYTRHTPTGMPERVGPYHLLRVLGEGGMGLVFEAMETGAVRRRVALKVIRREIASREVLARFEAERQALALMDHPGIARVLSAGETADGGPWFAMELVRGLPITEYCDAHRLSTRDRIELFGEVCRAVQHAHQKGVIHRDLKPSNVLVTEESGRPQPKVIDFGIAKALGRSLTDQTLVTQVGATLGTYAYMSPEQAESSGLDVDTRADIYSLGVMLYELLVGRLPIEPSDAGMPAFYARLAFGGDTVPRPSVRVAMLGTVGATVADARGTDLERLRRELRGDLDWIVMKAIDPERARRYDTANGLALDLERLLGHQPITARPPSTAYRVRKFVRRHRVGTAASVLGVVALGASAALATVGMLRATRAERQAAAEAAAARQVTDFLVDLFRVSGPGAASADSVTARELLDRGAERAARDLRAQPALQGHMQQAIGTAYSSLGLYDQARGQLREALAARTAALGAGDPAVAETELSLGEAARAKGEYDAADAHLRNALAIREATVGAKHPEASRVLASIAALRLSQGHAAAAESLYLRALAVDERVLSADDPRLARVLMGLAAVHWQQGRLAEAEVRMRRSLSIQERRLGPDHPDVAAALNNLGALEWTQGNYAEALPLYERTRRIFERALDPMHPDLGSVLNNLAETFWKLKRHREAEPLFRRALAIKEARLSAGHPSIAVTLDGLAGMLRDEGRVGEAESVYRRALEIRERALGASDASTRETARALAALLRRSGRAAEADRIAARYPGR